MKETDPNALKARFVYHLLDPNEVKSTVVYLCDDPEVGIGWRIRRITQAWLDGESVSDAEDHSITAMTAYDVMRTDACARIYGQTVEVAQDLLDDHPEEVAILLAGAVKLRDEV